MCCLYLAFVLIARRIVSLQFIYKLIELNAIALRYVSLYECRGTDTLCHTELYNSDQITIKPIDLIFDGGNYREISEWKKKSAIFTAFKMVFGFAWAFYTTTKCKNIRQFFFNTSDYSLIETYIEQWCTEHIDWVGVFARVWQVPPSRRNPKIRSNCWSNENISYQTYWMLCPEQINRSISFIAILNTFSSSAARAIITNNNN